MTVTCYPYPAKDGRFYPVPLGWEAIEPRELAFTRGPYKIQKTWDSWLELYVNNRLVGEYKDKKLGYVLALVEAMEREASIIQDDIHTHDKAGDTWQDDKQVN